MDGFAGMMGYPAMRGLSIILKTTGDDSKNGPDAVSFGRLKSIRDKQLA
jgi:hypothetical protein